MTTPASFVSMNPESFEEGGGAIPSGNLLVKEARYEIFNYGGRAPATFAAKLVMLDDANQEYTQYYSGGDPGIFQPSPDGKYAIPQGMTKSFRSSSNIALLFTEAVNAGFPQNRIEGDISVFDGWYVEFKEKAQPDRPGLASSAPIDGTPARKRTITLPVRTINLPGEASTRAAAGGAPPTSTVGAPAAPTADPATLNAEGLNVVKTAIANNGGTSTQRADLSQVIFTSYAGNPIKDALLSHIFQAEFLSHLAVSGFAVSGETITPTS